MSEKVPKIRFKGFEEEWNEDIIEDLCLISTGKSNTQDKVQDGKYPFYVRSPIIESSNRYLYDEEAVLTVGDGVGTGKVFHYVNGKYDLHQRVYRMYEFNENIIPKYFYYIFSKDFNDRVMSMTAKTSVDSVRYEMISQMKVMYPSIKEQEFIYVMMDNLDTIINNYKNKYDKLINIKKSMLEKMFPKEGQNIPEIRFKGFTEPWQESELKEVCDVYDGTHQTPNYTDSGVMFLSVENIKTLKSNKYISEEDFISEFKIYPEKNDVLMTRIGDIGTANVYEEDEPKAYYVSLALLKYKKLNPYFLKECIHSENVKKDIWKRTLHIAFPKKINKNEIEKVIIQYPKEIEEQIKIGKYFKNLDDLINQNAQQLEKLKNIKKALLEKMFI
ncbi:TPA: restriction endonuclease subunit S [Clostridioides difficile]|uniref:restriction endonuclease subunit S n=1 Tax=Clostridioides difficile TaxID=1496 RepID=UPI000B3C6C27|nr:restriction endonuclease subunit S [Clostridioides difficile]MEC5403320.1 restriction endonuclease subunit S [Clostridioides difficile]TLE39800.1 restriction endonuclease subunit S [Clostridioides difficile]HBE9333764.1 restriction endonuclease subunit S [Clostridioides difficile]